MPTSGCENYLYSAGVSMALERALEKLELVASLTAPFGSETSNSETELESILRKSTPPRTSISFMFKPPSMTGGLDMTC